MSSIVSLNVFASSLSQAYNKLVCYWYFLHSHMKANGTFNNSCLPTSLFTCVKKKDMFLALSLKCRTYTCNWTSCSFYTITTQPSSWQSACLHPNYAHFACKTSNFIPHLVYYFAWKSPYILGFLKHCKMVIFFISKLYDCVSRHQFQTEFVTCRNDVIGGLNS